MNTIKKLTLLIVMGIACSCGAKKGIDTTNIEENSGQVVRVEPRSWWVKMKTPLQLLIQGKDIASWSVEVGDNSFGVAVKKVNRADNPNFIFVDIEIDKLAEAKTYNLVFTKGTESFKVAYNLEARREGSAERESFTSADMVYLLMPDRFANGDESNDSIATLPDKLNREDLFGRHGGDIQGIINNLDYIAQTGATAIWSTPLLLDNEPQATYHGYACADYYQIDPRYGSNELYRTYVEKAHEKDLKIIMDIVTNHCGGAHWWMEEMPFNDWVHKFPTYTTPIHEFAPHMDVNGSKHDLKIQDSGWFDTSMPDMNLDNPYLLQYFKQWAIWWIEYSNLDGLRVDTYPYNEKIPMSEWCKAVRNEYPNINIVGECWTSSIPQLAYWQADNINKDRFNSNLPCIMDFPLRNAICEGLPKDSKTWGNGLIKVYEDLSHDFVYNDVNNMLIFTANHDTDRIGDILNKDAKRLKISMTMLATMRGIPQIFAGDEMMFVSKDITMGHGGLRVDFPGGWSSDKVNLFNADERNAEQADIFNHTQKIFNWRKNKEVIHSGKTIHFASRDNTYAYFRYNSTDAVFVFINNSRGAKNIPWTNYTEIANTLNGSGVNVLTGEAMIITDSTKVNSKEALVVEFKRSAQN